ncbi:MAG TPA: aldo/keto reductase [Solirubrobacterales bacterium]|jgi:aryl-alcohol dehydrogenase-like predicted oxidoreductase
MPGPGRTAIGSWSGGRFLRFGEAIEPERLEALLRPDEGISTVMTADVYGQGEADSLVGRALADLPRDKFSLVGAVGHDFYEGEREGPRGFPRFTDPSLRGPEDYAGYLRMAAERSLERLGQGRFDLLLLHNPDRTGYESAAVWEAMAALRDQGIADAIGVAPGPANGFTLDLIGCFERFGEELDWAMVILNPFEPWPAELALDAAAERGVRVITRVVDHGGLFWDDVTPETELPQGDHRNFRPEGWIAEGRAKLDRLRPLAERVGLTPMHLACQWNLAHPAVSCVVPTLIQELGEAARPIEEKRAELASLPADARLSDADVEEIRAVGDNSGCMALKGASPDHSGEERPDRWAVSAELAEVAGRWEIEPERDLRQAAAAAR